MACECISKVNKLLAENNTELVCICLSNRETGAMREAPVIQTQKTNTAIRSKKQTLAPTFCPFCGVKYVE